MFAHPSRHAFAVVLAVSLVGASWACSKDGPATSSADAATASSPAPRSGDWSRARAGALQTIRDLDPLGSVSLGLHDYDGKVRDVSPDGLAAAESAMVAALAELDAVDPRSLSAIERVELDSLRVRLDGDLFELQVRRSRWRNPMVYVNDVELTPYVSRDYQPVDARAQAVIAVAKASVAHFEHAKGNLEAELPAPFVDTALLQTRGTIAFVRDDVPKALAGLDEARAKELGEALATMQGALEGYEAYLVERQASANADFRLGEATFLEMLRRTQGIDMSLDELHAMAHADLERNWALAIEAARQIDPNKDIEAVMAEVAADKPEADQVLAAATQQAVDARQFLLEKAIVTIPTEDVVEVTETPTFMRWNSAFLDGAGPFETAPLPSFYYISPPDPSWPEAQQVAYIPGRTDLLFITVHEVWPGHFLHGLHVDVNASEVLRSLWNFTTGEGWAHYTEEMMWDEGLSTDPKVRLGQLQNALLRNVRFLSALGLHTGAMTVDESAELFRTRAFQDPVNAEQQAKRGTFDPMYLAYTLGKLMILDLREQWLAAGEGRTLGQFHDALLSYACAPLPAVRAAMLEEG